MMRGRRGGGLPDITVLGSDVVNEGEEEGAKGWLPDITVLGGDVVNKGEEGWLPDGTVRGCYVERYAER